MSDDSACRQKFRHDVLIIGGGAAGLSLALRLPVHLKVAIIAKGGETASSTYYAQGGVSAVLRKDDSYEAHITDTLDAGGGLCDEAAVRFTVEHGPDNIRWLAKLGVPFTADTHQAASSTPLMPPGAHSKPP
jgi:L-aspartate oxidase